VTDHPLIERVRTSPVPVAALIGFSIEPLGDGHAWEARLRFDARVVNRSKNTAYLECDITDHDGTRIAKAASTCTVLRGDQAKAR